jgi:hypothetical protein
MAQYYIFRITTGPTELVRTLEKLARHNNFRDAKLQVKQLRKEQATGDSSIFKVIFADNELQAEEMLQEKREASVVQEWEK